MNYKILCSDLDGTLLSSKSDVSNFAISEISKIKDTLKIILVSARMPQAMTYIQQDLGIEDQPIICYNGAFVLHGNQELASTHIAIDHVETIYKMAEVLGIKLGLYYKEEWYAEDNTERIKTEIKYTKTKPIFRKTQDTLADWRQRKIGPHKIMLMGTKDTSNSLLPELQSRFNDKLHLYRSNDTLIEIAPKSVSKLSAIALLLTKEETLKDVIAFGDNYNDIEMLKNVGCGVAVENAREEVKTVAKFITLKNTEDGVAHFIKQHLVI